MMLNGIRNKDINIYPNPAKNEFFVLINREILPIVINVFDNSGKLITKKQIISSNVKINTLDYPCRFYIIKATGRNISYTEKIIINK